LRRLRISSVGGSYLVSPVDRRGSGGVGGLVGLVIVDAANDSRRLGDGAVWVTPVRVRRVPFVVALPDGIECQFGLQARHDGFEHRFAAERASGHVEHRDAHLVVRPGNGDAPPAV
jgi:hypothetical protein